MSKSAGILCCAIPSYFVIIGICLRYLTLIDSQRRIPLTPLASSIPDLLLRLTRLVAKVDSPHIDLARTFGSESHGGDQETFARCKSDRMGIGDGNVQLQNFADQYLSLLWSPMSRRGFPSIAETPDILLGMEAGGSDIIELGVSRSQSSKKHTDARSAPSQTQLRMDLLYRKPTPYE
ncbi:hypothetical protein MRB53_041838 [Persea americana]|nr:hypothetical protein MRB53_041838 [Persea americana]